MSIDVVGKADLYWLIGFLEGEGSFGLWKSKGYASPYITVSSNDYDVIRKAAKILGASTVRIRKGKNLTNNTHYVISIHGKSAIDWMTKLQNLMGDRRRFAIEKALSGHTFKGKRKLSFQVVRKIRELYVLCDTTEVELANRFGVSQSMISRILNNQSWVEPSEFELTP